MSRCLLACLALACAAGARAQTVEQFYRGRVVKVLVGSQAGGGTDVMARLLARHVGKYIPGSPSVVVQNIPGANGIVGANRVATAIERDGSEFGTIERAIPQLAIAGEPNVRFDPLSLTWLGSLSSYRDDAFMLIVNASHPVRRAEELRDPARLIHVGASQQGSTNLTFALIAKSVLGLAVDAIPGYGGTAKIALAIQAGEVDGELIGVVAMQASQRGMWEGKRVRPLVQFARQTRHRDLPDVPTGRELALTPEGLALLEFAELPFFMAQSFVAPAGVPADRAEALRAAFMSATRDPEYVAEARKIEMDNSPIDHREIESLLRRATATPKSVVAEFDRLVNRR